MRTYPSKISWGLFVLPALFFMGLLIYMVVKGESQITIVGTGGTFALVLLLILYTLTHTFYRIAHDMLYVRCGFFYKRQLSIHKIKDIRKTKDLISAPAASLDRIQINYDKYGVLIISPKNKADFIKVLLSINPNIKLYPGA